MRSWEGVVQMASLKYQVPAFLSTILSQKEYERWLRRRAIAHVKRDKKRGNLSALAEKYRIAIHNAVLDSEGRDYYTGEGLNWALVSAYDNLESKAHGRKYKARFALLPTVDHVDDGRGDPNFRICAWRTNDAKNDLTHEEFVSICRLVVAHYGVRFSVKVSPQVE